MSKKSFTILFNWTFQIVVYSLAVHHFGLSVLCPLILTKCSLKFE
jgi:hypothetical protein